jgi:hypothetical protein
MAPAKGISRRLFAKGRQRPLFTNPIMLYLQRLSRISLDQAVIT